MAIRKIKGRLEVQCECCYEYSRKRYYAKICSDCLDDLYKSRINGRNYRTTRVELRRLHEQFRELQQKYDELLKLKENHVILETYCSFCSKLFNTNTIKITDKIIQQKLCPSCEIIVREMIDENIKKENTKCTNP